MNQLIRRVKEEYEAAIEMHKKTRDPYWSGRIALARELLNMVRKEDNCLLCDSDD